jgi:hypothetical protein
VSIGGAGKRFGVWVISGIPAHGLRDAGVLRP